MLVKILKNGREQQFNSQEEDIAILLTPKDKQAIKDMPEKDLLIVSAPFSSMATNAAKVWQWAMTGWKGATYVSPESIRNKT